MDAGLAGLLLHDGLSRGNSIPQSNDMATCGSNGANPASVIRWHAHPLSNPDIDDEA